MSSYVAFNRKANISKFRIRKDYHKRCNVPSHAGYSKQRQTCKGCVYDSIERCHRGGFALPQTYKQVLAVSRSYWCPFCIKRSVEAGTFHAPTALKLFRSCRKHRELFMCKECPCGLPWAACLRCMDEEVDPRAGGAPAVCAGSGAGRPAAAPAAAGMLRPRR